MKRISFLVLFLLFLAAGVVLVAGVGFYWRHVGDMLERDATSQITLAGNETAESFERAIAADQRIVDTIAITVQQNYPWRSRAGLERFLRLQVKYNEFENLGIIPLHGGEVISAKPGLTDRAWLQEILLRGLEEDTFVSARQTDPLGGPEVFVQAASLHNGEEPVGVLFALIPTKRYQSSLKLTSVGDGRVFVVARDGRVEASSSASQDTNIFTTLAQAKFARPNSLESVRKQIQEGKTTFVRYQLNGSPRLLYGMALKINNWYLLSVLPTDFIQAQAQHLTWLSLALFACICLLFGVLLAYMFRLREYSNRQLFNTAFVDSLTGAYNLNRMADIFPQRLRELPENAALALFDILKFKVINDMLGYERGNVVLKQVAFLLRGNLMPGECFCRSTADNFLLLLSYKDRRELRTRLSGLATLIRRNCTVSDSCIMVDGAFGVYELKEPIPFYIALDRAHLALDNAKHSSTDTIQFYDEKDRHRIVRERQLENTMEQSLEAGDFTVELQPKFDFQTGQMKGAEALVRWKQTARGLVRPDDFIPLFEKNGFILRLDMFILQRVARLLSCWKEQGKQQVPVAVNFSRLHLNDSRYISQMLRTLEAYGVSPELIEVELTESVILNNWELAQSVIRGLHNRGFSVAMDDFGSGYSSLNVLKSLQFDTIKLDKEFLSGCEQDATARRVIQGAVEMIKSVGATIVAEGVETAEQAEFLRKIGCDLAQGYYFSRPLATEEFEQLLSQQNK